MSKVKAQQGRIKAVALVRNAQGQPQFNDWQDIPSVFHPFLTEDDWVYIQSKQENK